MRCNPGEDATNGFFVACFVRKGEGEESRKRSGDSQDAVSNPRPKKKKKKSKGKDVSGMANEVRAETEQVL